MQSAGFPTSPEGLDALQVQENSICPVQPEYDDEPITNTIQVIPSQLNTCPYSFTTTLPTFSTTTYGLLILASRYTRWTTIAPDSLIPTVVTQSIRQTILQQTPTIIRTNTNALKLSRDACSITSLAFTGLRPTECYEVFRASPLHTTFKLVTTTKYNYQQERAASNTELSSPLQALLHVMGAIQPATKWSAEERPNTITFTPLDVDYNPFRLQSMSSSLYLTHAESPRDSIRYLVRPPRLRSDLRGETFLAPWWRTAVLVQSSAALHLPSMYAHDSHTPQDYLLQALLVNIAMATSYLSSTNNITSDHATIPPIPIPTHDGSHIISHLRKDTSTQLTNFIILMASPHTHAMITTMDIQVKIRLSTVITIAGSHHRQIVHIQLNFHNRSILSRAYKRFFQNLFTQNIDSTIPIPKVL